MIRIDSLQQHGSFKLDGVVHTILRFENGMVVCEREDGTIVYLGGHLPIDLGITKFNWFSSVLP